jgi:ubiquitin C-terminal hydrolase
LIDVLQCSSCGHRSITNSTFLNISLDIPDRDKDESGGGGGGEVLQLAPLLASHLQPEVLDEQNKWTCSGCQQSVCATKSHELTRLPDHLWLHVKRFRYDQVQYVLTCTLCRLTATTLS